MKNLGDVTTIKGGNVPIVNVVIGGSPCQNLSMAGNRKGLDGEQSCLFLEQIRIIREMREEDERNGRTGADVRPRFMVWENVPGAFSTNKGRDFATVLHEVCKVAEPKAPVVSVPERGWPTAGCLVGVGGQWSVAWRVLDAQFWGVPQRRRRIALVADFGGLTAPEILFEREGVSGYYPQGRTPWERATRTAESRSGKAGTGVIAYCIQGNCIDRADTAGCNGKGWTEGVSYTLNTVDRPAVHAVEQGGGKSGANVSEGIAPTLTCTHGGEPAVAIPLSDVASTLRSAAGAPKHEADVKGRLVLPVDSSAVYDARGNGDGKAAPTMTGGGTTKTMLLTIPPLL